MSKTMTVAAAIAHHLHQKRIVGQFGAIATPEQRAAFDNHDRLMHNVIRHFGPSLLGMEKCGFEEQQSQWNFLVFSVHVRHPSSHLSMHTLRVRPAFTGFDITCTGPNFDGALVKLLDAFDSALALEIAFSPVSNTYYSVEAK